MLLPPVSGARAARRLRGGSGTRSAGKARGRIGARGARRAAAAVLSASLAAACGASGGRPVSGGPGRPVTTPAAALRGSTWRLFAARSFWNLPSADTGTSGVSGDPAVGLRSQIAAFHGIVGINTTSYTPPVYTVASGYPTVRVAVWDCQKKGRLDPGLQQQFSAVPLPPQARPAAGRDEELVVVQPATDTMWEFWRMERRGPGWAACWGGRLTHVSTSLGVFPYPYGTTATGLPLIGGLIRIDELRSGAIRHVLSMSLPLTARRRIVPPARRTDGTSSSATAVAEGQRFELSSNVDIDSLKLSAAGKAIARAMQQYGVIIRDTAGAPTLYAEDPAPLMALGQPNPYPTLFDGEPTYDVLRGLPWEQMIALGPNA